MITVLAGGTGGAKLVRGLARVRPASELCIIVNTGDDFVVHGLYVSPDVDTILYALAGVLSRRRGWGIRGDTFRCNERLGRLGMENWFRLGDQDLATHLFRTSMMSKGLKLSDVTRHLAEKYGISSLVLPMTDDRVETRIKSSVGELGFQEYFVKHRHTPEVYEVLYEGASEAEPAPGVVEAVQEAHGIIIAPSNPVTSIGPILAIGEVRRALRAARVRVAISPFLGGRAISGPADVLMRARDLEPTPVGLIRAYNGLIDYLIIDEADEGWTAEVRKMGVEPLVSRIVMRNEEDEAYLAGVAIQAMGVHS